MRFVHGRRRARTHLGQVPVEGLQQGDHAARCCAYLALALGLLEPVHPVLRQAGGCAQRAGARERQGQRARRVRHPRGAAYTTDGIQRRSQGPILPGIACVIAAAGHLEGSGTHARPGGTCEAVPG